MGIDLKTQNSMRKAGDAREKPKAYTTAGTVARVTGGVAYVRFDGSDIETPVYASNVEVARGDTVEVSVSHNDTRITGNRSDKAQTGTTVLATASSVVNAAVNAATDAIRRTISSVQGDVTELSVEAGEISTKVSDVEGNVTELSQTATAIRADLTSAEGDIAKLSATATELRSDMESADGALQSSISQTASQIRSEVSDVESSLSTSISQTSTSLTTKISYAQSTADATATLIHQYSGGVIVCKYPNTVGALVNADGEFDVVKVGWSYSSSSGYTPYPAATLAAFSSSGIGGMWLDAFASKTVGAVSKDTWTEVDFKLSSFKTASGESVPSGYYPYVPVKVKCNKRKMKMCGFNVNPSAADGDATYAVETFWSTNGADSATGSDTAVGVQVMFFKKSPLYDFADTTDSDSDD